MNRSGKQEMHKGVMYLGVFVMLGLLVLGSYAIFFRPAPQSVTGTGNVVLTPQEQVAAANSCGSNKQTAVTLTLKNALNTSASETQDASYVIYQIGADNAETQVASGTDTTAGAQTLDCGQKYRLELLGGSVMNSRITSVFTKNAQIDSDGSVIFTTTAPSLTIGMMGSKHGELQVRAYNEDARARMVAASGSSTEFSGTGVEFFSTIDNATAQTVTAGSSMLMTVEVKSTMIESDFNDYGTYVLMDAANTYWDNVQQVTFDGADLQNVKATLSPDEAKKFADYEFVYLIPQGKSIDGKNHKLYFDVLKANGATGSGDLKVDFVTRSNFLSVDGYTVKTAAAKDSSTNPLVVPKFEITFHTQ